MTGTDPEREAYLARRRRAEYLRSTGRGLIARGEEQRRIVARLRSFRARGMSCVQMARQVGMRERTLRDIMQPEAAGLKRSNLVLVQQIRFEEPDPTAFISPVGTRRRLGALWADGFPVAWLADQIDVGNREYVQALIRGSKGRSWVTWHTHKAVAGLYEKLEGREPAEVGIGQRKSRFAARFAAKKGMAPRKCWDEDTIDDPMSLPQWTGCCGTWIGHHIHERDDIPMCWPCAGAAPKERYPGFDREKLRAIREKAGYSRIRLAAEAGDLHATTIQQWEDGRSKPARGGKLDRVLAVLDVSLDEVCEEV